MFKLRIIKNFIIVVIIFVATAYPQKSILNTSLQNQILTGLNATFNFDFITSRKVFDHIIKKDSSNPTGYHFKSIPYLWQFLDNRNETDLMNFMVLSDSTIAKAKRLLAINPNDPFLYFVLGTANSYQAMVFTRQEDYLDAVLATKKSFANLNNSILVDSTFYDGYLVIGLFNFMIAQTPPALKWAMHLTGISGDKEKGLEYIKLVAQKGKFSLVEAQYYLSQILIEFYREEKESGKILTKLTNKYNKNLLFRYSLANYYLKQTRLNDSENNLKKIISSKDTSFNQLIRYSKLLMGDIYFFRNRFDIAKNYYEDFIKDSTENHFRGIGAYRLGLCYSFLKDTLNAEAYFNFSDEGNNDIDDDRYAKEMGKKYSKTFPESYQLKIVYIKNLIRSGRYNEARDSLLRFDKAEIQNPHLAETNLLLSEVYLKLNDYTLSYSYALSAIENDEAEKWIYAFAYYYAASASVELDYFDDAINYIGKARSYSDYFYENKLDNMLNALEYKIQKAGEGEENY